MAPDLLPGMSRKRRFSIKQQSVDLLPQNFDYENQYDKWREQRPRMNYELEFSIDENGYIYWIWTLFVVCGVIYNFLILTTLAFEEIRIEYFNQFVPCNAIFDLIFLLDIFVQTRLSFYDQGVLVTNYCETRSHYFHSQHFIYDLLSIVPFDFFVIKNPKSAFCRLNRFFKIYRVANFIAQSYGKLGQVTISISKILIACFLLFHINACAFYLISMNSDHLDWDGINATFDDDEILPWPYMPEKITNAYFVGCDGRVDCYNPNFYFDEERESKLIELYHFWRMMNRTWKVEFTTFTKEYTLSMYWSAMTLTTLGEQPSPNTSAQNLFEVGNTIFGLLLFAVIMGSIGDLVSNSNKVKTYWQTLMDGLKQYMTYRSLNSDLQLKVLKYCAYEMTEETILKEHEVRDELPAKLYGQVTKSIIGQSLLKCPLFRASERSFLDDISEYLEPHYFCPGDVVVEKGQLCTAMLVIVYGRIIEMTDTEDIEHIEGEVLGDHNLIWFNNHKNNNRHFNNFVSNSYSQVHLLYRDDFFKILASYDLKLKQRLADVAYRLQKEKGELNDLKREDVENEDLETNFKSLAVAASEIEQNLNELESQFLNFTITAKQRLFKAEVTMCHLSNNQLSNRRLFV